MVDQLTLDLLQPIEPQLLLLSVDEIYEGADLSLLTRLKEDRRIERKSPRIQPATLAEYFSMFGNTPPDGGIIVIGLEDDGSIAGCSSLDSNRLNDLERTGDVYCPDARYEVKKVPVTLPNETDDFIILIRVSYNDRKLVETNKREAFSRRGESKRKLLPDEKREIQISKGEVELENEPCKLNYPGDFNITKIQEFASNYRKSRRLPDSTTDEEILILRRLCQKQAGELIPSIACALLFAKDPMKVIPGGKIRFLRFEGEHEGTGSKFNAIKDVWIEGRVPHLIVEAEKVIESQIRDFTRFDSDGKFYTAPEYPKEAWYEAIVNACAHRSYNLKNMTIFVKMFDDRLVIESPGGFPPLVTPENIYEMHHPRNRNLMEAMYYLNFVKCAHEGTRRMRDTMTGMDLPAPEFSQDAVGSVLVRVTLRNNISHRKVFIDAHAVRIVGEAIFETLNEQQRRIINFVAENQTINVSEVQRLTQRSWPASKKLLMSLVEKGILEHVRRRPMLDRDPKAHFVLSRGAVDE